MDQSSTPSPCLFISAALFLSSLSSLYPPSLPSLSLLSRRILGPLQGILKAQGRGCHFKMSPPWNKDPVTIVFFFTSSSARLLVTYISLCARLRHFPAFWHPKPRTCPLRCKCFATCGEKKKPDSCIICMKEIGPRFAFFWRRHIETWLYQRRVRHN